MKENKTEVQKKETTRKSDKLFDYLDNILVAKNVEKWQHDVDEIDFKKRFPVFMVLKFLSMNMNPDVRKVVLEDYVQLSRIGGINPEGLYLYLLKHTPQLYTSRTTFLK